MVDFKYMMSDEYKQKKTKRDKIKQQEENLRNKTCSFTGHRPDKLYGYDINTDNYIELAKLIRAECIRLIEEKGVNRFISGGALGLDTIAFLIVHKLKKQHSSIENILAIPFKNQAIKWFRQTDIDRYNKMKEYADKIVYVDLLDKYKVIGIDNDIYHPAKEYMCNDSRYTIAIWDGGKKGGTWNCIKYAKNNGNEITKINPKHLDITYNLQCLL